MALQVFHQHISERAKKKTAAGEPSLRTCRFGTFTWDSMDCFFAALEVHLLLATLLIGPPWEDLSGILSNGVSANLMWRWLRTERPSFMEWVSWIHDL